MRVLKTVATLALIAGLSGCAHSAMQGSVAMKTSENEAHVCMGKGEVAAGDRVTLYRNACVGKARAISGTGSEGSCEKKEIGMGSVKEVLNDHYSVVRFDQGVQFEEGTFVEKR